MRATEDDRSAHWQDREILVEILGRVEQCALFAGTNELAPDGVTSHLKSTSASRMARPSVHLQTPKQRLLVNRNGPGKR
jgi:hypothetical protein